MKKKLGILLAFVLTFAMSLALFAGCGEKKGEDVTVTLSPTTATIETGKTRKLTAIVSDGVSEVEWSSSNAAVASVDNGTVKGESAGTATITATVKGGTAKAECAVTVKDPVTVTFKDSTGTAVTSVQLDRAGVDSVQLTATASDGSAITSWVSADNSIATVENGLVTAGTKEGTTTVSAYTSTGSGTVTVTVVDSVEGEHYTITTDEVIGKWRYFSNSSGGQEIEVNQAEFRHETVTFDFGGECNWNPDDVFIAYKNPNLTDGGTWYKLSMNVNSSIDTYVTVNDTRVHLNKGDNAVSVCYEQWDAASAIMHFGNATMGTHPNVIKVVLSNITWAEHTPVDLEMVDFAISGDTITFTNNSNTEGVDKIELGLFNESGELVFTQNFYTEAAMPTNGAIDTSTMKQNGEFTAKIRVIGNLGYNDTEWSTATVTYNVTNADAAYDFTTDAKHHGAGASAALTSGRWELWAVIEEGASYSSARYENGTVTLNCSGGWSWYSVQLFRHFAQYKAGTQLTVSMTILSDVGGDITVCGQKVTLEANVSKDVTLTTTQPSAAGQTTVLIALGVQGNGQQPATGSLPGYTNVVFKVSNLSVTPA